MKNDNTCSKCGSTELMRIPPVPGEEPHIALGHPVIHAVSVTKFVCGRCGYLEQWVENTQDLKALKDEYVKQ